MRQSNSLFIVAMLLTVALCPVLSVAQDSSPADQLEVPMVIIFSDGRWHYVTMLEENYGSFVYSKPGGRPVATTEYELDRKRTLEVNGALQDLVRTCQGEAPDFAGIFGLQGRSRQIFGKVISGKLSDCYQRARNQYEQARPEAKEASQKRTLSDVAGEIAIKKTEEGSETVISNESVGDGDSAVTEGGQNLGGGYNHHAEYVLRSEAVIKEECWDKWAGDGSMYRHCVEEETAAVNRMKSRTIPLDVYDEFNGIRDECRQDWPRDYSMRNDCESDQIRSFRLIEQKMNDPDFSLKVLQGFKATCVAEWPGDFRMQKNCLEDKMEEMRPSP